MPYDLRDDGGGGLVLPGRPNARFSRPGARSVVARRIWIASDLDKESEDISLVNRLCTLEGY